MNFNTWPARSGCSFTSNEVTERSVGVCWDELGYTCCSRLVNKQLTFYFVFLLSIFIHVFKFLLHTFRESSLFAKQHKKFQSHGNNLEYIEMLKGTSALLIQSAVNLNYKIQEMKVTNIDRNDRQKMLNMKRQETKKQWSMGRFGRFVSVACQC